MRMETNESEVATIAVAEVHNEEVVIDWIPEDKNSQEAMKVSIPSKEHGRELLKHKKFVVALLAYDEFRFFTKSHWKEQILKSKLSSMLVKITKQRCV